MKRSIAVVWIVAALGLSAQGAQQAATPSERAVNAAPREAVTPYYLLDTVIRSLAQAHDAITEINAQKNDDFFGKMVALKNANVEIAVARQRLQPLAESDNEDVKAASEAMVAAFGYMRESVVMQLAAYEQLNLATSSEQVLALRGPMSDAAVKYQQSSKILLDAAGIVVASAAVADPKDPANHIALMMSADEKAAVIKTLKSLFGGKLATTNGNTGPMSAAKVMLISLDQDWRLIK